MIGYGHIFVIFLKISNPPFTPDLATTGFYLFQLLEHSRNCRIFKNNLSDQLGSVKCLICLVIIIKKIILRFSETELCDSILLEFGISVPSNKNKISSILKYCCFCAYKYLVDQKYVLNEVEKLIFTIHTHKKQHSFYAGTLDVQNNGFRTMVSSAWNGRLFNQTSIQESVEYYKKYCIN